MEGGREGGERERVKRERESVCVEGGKEWRERKKERERERVSECECECECVEGGKE